MRIARAICVRVMYAVRRYPLNWTTFKGHCAAGHEKVFNYFRHFITAVSEQPVTTHSDAKTATDPVKDYCGNQSRPAPEKESCDGSKMRNNQKNASAPINGVSSQPVSLQCDFQIQLDPPEQPFVVMS